MCENSRTEYRYFRLSFPLDHPKGFLRCPFYCLADRYSLAVTQDLFSLSACLSISSAHLTVFPLVLQIFFSLFSLSLSSSSLSCSSFFCCFAVPTASCVKLIRYSYNLSCSFCILLSSLILSQSGFCSQVFLLLRLLRVSAYICSFNSFYAHFSTYASHPGAYTAHPMLILLVQQPILFTLQPVMFALPLFLPFL